MYSPNNIKYYYVKATLYCIVFILLNTAVHAQSDTILARYKRYLFQQIEPATIQSLTASYDSTLQWTDLDYSDKQPANWQVLKHLQRTRDMALIWANPRSSSYHDPAAWKIIQAALDHWLQKRPQNTNWWHNQIGVPQYMRDIIVLLRDTLTNGRLTACLQVLAQYRLQNNGVGANLVWSADLGLHYGALTRNDSLIKQCVTLITTEIQITTGDGIQPDLSFHQHGSRLQMYQYGGAFLWDNARLAWQLKGTAWEYPQEKINILTDHVLNSWQWMARGINTVPGTIDRSVSRVGTLHSADIRLLIPYLCDLDPAHTTDFLAISARQNGKGQPLEGFRYFPYSDFSVYQNKKFAFFIKTISDRTLATESINNENLKGRLLNSGDAYLVQNGKEYFDLMPCWDWEKLPGITGFKNADKILRRPFVGSVTNGKSGMTVMDYCLQGKNDAMVSAKKLWACHNGIIVCLIAGLQKSNVEDEAFTVLNQCRWQDDVHVNTQKESILEGDHVLNQLRWIYHDGIAYFFPQPTNVAVSIKKVTGAWSSINASGPKEPVTEKIFTPAMIHPVSSGSISTGYAITSCATIGQVRSLEADPGWKILRNDTVCQAIRFKDGMLMTAFFSAGSVMIGKKKLAVDKPCLLMIKKGRLYASDPSQVETTVTIRFNDKIYPVQLPAHGFSTSIFQIPE
jgi:chondroitin AC lyase